jgi:hypothetical protein
VLPNRSAVSKADAQRFVAWQAQKALAAAVQITATHSEWTDGIDTGARVHVRVPSRAIDEDVVVSSISYTVGQSAVDQWVATCTLPDAYSFRPLRPAVERRVAGWGGIQQGVTALRSGLQ